VRTHPDSAAAGDAAPLRVGAYARVSTTNQLLENDSSLDTQLHRIRQRASYESDEAKHSGRRAWRITAEYREEGRSGKDTERPALQRMLADVAAGKLDAVCVTKIDRITRSLIDFYDLWSAFEEHHVEFFALDDKFETASATGRAMLKITLVFAELERERTSERTREKTLARRSAGKWFGGQIPFGYRVHPTNKTSLEVDPATAKLVRTEFFEKFLEVGSARAVLRHVNRRGILRPTGTSRRGKKLGGTSFAAQGVLTLLSNPVYVGKRRMESGELIDCSWPGIIEPELFQRAQDLLARNSADRPNPRRSPHYVYLLEGLLRCGSCHGGMSRAIGHGRTRAYFYYRCSRKQRSAGHACMLREVPAEAVEKFVLEQLRGLSIDPDAIRAAVREVNAGRDDAAAKLRSEADKVKASLTAARKTIASLTDAIEAGGDAAALVARLREREAQVADLRRELATLEEKVAATERQTVSAEAVVEGYTQLHRLLDDAIAADAREELRDVLRAIIDVVEWREDPSEPRSGEALIQLFEIPAGFWAPEKDKPDDPAAVNQRFVGLSRLAPRRGLEPRTR
jgi:site-specific DNA recombinase